MKFVQEADVAVAAIGHAAQRELGDAHVQRAASGTAQHLTSIQEANDACATIDERNVLPLPLRKCAQRAREELPRRVVQPVLDLPVFQKDNQSLAELRGRAAQSQNRALARDLAWIH